MQKCLCVECKIFGRPLIEFISRNVNYWWCVPDGRKVKVKEIVNAIFSSFFWMPRNFGYSKLLSKIPYVKWVYSGIMHSKWVCNYFARIAKWNFEPLRKRYMRHRKLRCNLLQTTRFAAKIAHICAKYTMKRMQTKTKMRVSIE